MVAIAPEPPDIPCDGRTYWPHFSTSGPTLPFAAPRACPWPRWWIGRCVRKVFY